MGKNRHQTQPTTAVVTSDGQRRLQLALEAQIVAAGAAGVTTFNTRSGAVSLTTGDVTLALGYTPTSITGLVGIQSPAAIKTGLALDSVDNTADAAKNVLSATKLTTARNINGVAFDGTANITINAVDSTARAPETRTIATTAPLTGGGDLTANRTIAISAATTGAAGSMSAADKTKLDAITGTNTGNQTSIVGITGTLAEFNTALTGADFASGGGTATGTNTGDETKATIDTKIGATGGTANFYRQDGTFAAPPGGGGSTPTGTGFTHITAGVQDAAAKLVDTADINNSQVTLGKMADVATATVFYRKTAAAGAPEVQTLATLKTDLGLTGTNSGDQTTVTGNAGTATALQTSRNINGVAFDGTANITINAVDSTARVPETRTISTTAPLAGGGDLSANRTLTIAAATTSLPGSMSAADKTKLDGVATAATANSSDAVLLARANHTGTQTPATVTFAATARFMGRITASAGPGEELTGTQATTLLDAFTSALKGLAPASGGGTVNFLRADGTWVAPTAGAAGSTTQIQYNLAGALAGATRLTVDATGNLVVAVASTSTIPAADAISFTPTRVGASGGSLMPRWRGEDGVNKTMQPHVGRNTIYHGQAHGSGATNITPTGGAVLGTVGTPTLRNVTTTNRLTRAKRVGFVSAATAGAAAGLFGQTANNQYTLGTAGSPAAGGFRVIIRFGCSDAATVAGAHSFVGMSSSTVTPAPATSPATLLNLIGVAQVAGSANLQLVSGGSAASAAVDLGANFPAADLTAEYELILYARPDANNVVSYRLENITTGNSTEGKITAATPGTQLPLNTTLLGPRMWRSNNATALAVGIDIVSFYVESDI